MVLPASEPVASTNQYPITAFYTTAQTTIKRQTLPAKMAKQLPNYPIPVFIIPCVAVHASLQGHGLGKAALINALESFYHASKNGISGIGVVIDPVDEKADAIYRNFGFDSLTENRLFMGMKTVEKLFD
jgi:GNAT superfamily N-acetyltransferase